MTYFKLSKRISTKNFVLFDKDDKLKRYKDELEILNEYFDYWIGYYSKRKEYLVSKIKRDVEIKKEKHRFIQAVIEGVIKLGGIKR